MAALAGIATCSALAAYGLFGFAEFESDAMNELLFLSWLLSLTPEEMKESSLHGTIDWFESMDLRPTWSSHLNNRILVCGVKPSCCRRVRGIMLMWLIDGGCVNWSFGIGGPRSLYCIVL